MKLRLFAAIAVLMTMFFFSCKEGEMFELNLELLGTYETGIFDESAAEIIVYDKKNKHLLFTSAKENAVVILDASNPAEMKEVKKVAFTEVTDGGINSVTIGDGFVAAAVENENSMSNGYAVFCDLEGNIINHVTVGNLPDMIAISKDGKYVLTANEGEPNDDYTEDPAGSISIIDMSKGAANLSDEDVTTLYFDDSMLKGEVRIGGPEGTTAATDLEPEYITIDQESKFAYVSCQENNAIAKVDIAAKSIVGVFGLGYKDHSKPENALDASDKDDKINITTYPLLGMYQPDAITSINVDGKTYILTANEGDGREYGDYEDEEKVEKITLDPVAFPNAAELQKKENLGRMRVSTVGADTDGDGDYDKLFSFGARSFSIFDDQIKLVYDSGKDFEEITAKAFPAYFNSDNDETEFDGRSAKKGPEPEGIAVGKVNGELYAFILIERTGGVMVYNVSDPANAKFATYVNNRKFAMSAEKQGDLAPEGVVFITAEDSPIGKPLVAVANEVSGTVSVYAITPNTDKQ